MRRAPVALPNVVLARVQLGSGREADLSELHLISTYSGLIEGIGSAVTCCRAVSLAASMGSGDDLVMCMPCVSHRPMWTMVFDRGAISLVFNKQD
jgi:hypothetical protein